MLYTPPKLLVHMMPWFGDGSIHRMDRYISNDPKVITQQLNCMQATTIAGMRVGGVIMTWQGVLAKFQHSTTLEVSKQCNDRGLLFALLIDPWCAKLGSNGATINVQNSIQDPSVQGMLNSPYYIPEKYILDFNSGARLDLLSQSFPTLNFLPKNKGFSWINIPASTSFNVSSKDKNALAVMDLISQHSNPLMKIPSICKEFKDAGAPTPPASKLPTWAGVRDYSLSVWGDQPCRNLDNQGGNFLQDQLLTIPYAFKYLAYVTWNDYDEGTEIESSASMFSNIRIGG